MSEDQVSLKTGIRAWMRRSSGWSTYVCLPFMSGSKVKLGRIQLFVAEGEVLKILGENNYSVLQHFSKKKEGHSPCILHNSL